MSLHPKGNGWKNAGWQGTTCTSSRPVLCYRAGPTSLRALTLVSYKDGCSITCSTCCGHDYRDNVCLQWGVGHEDWVNRWASLTLSFSLFLSRYFFFCSFSLSLSLSLFFSLSLSLSFSLSIYFCNNLSRSWIISLLDFALTLTGVNENSFPC